MRNLVLIVSCFLLALTQSSCKKIFGCEGADPKYVPTSPYQSPIWHPRGLLLGFNHQAVQSIAIGNNNCLITYAAIFYPDSSGFWIINKDGSNMRQVTTFQLYSPSWSPDGKWIAFCNGGVIYKMSFDGTSFDTSHIIALTDANYQHFFPSWSPHSDTIFYDSNRDAPNNTDFYSIWKMAADGSGQVRITDTAVSVSNGDIRQPVCTPDDQIIHYQYPIGTQQSQLFIMDANGNNNRQITHFTENLGTIDQYTYFNNQVYFEYNGIWRVNMDGSDAEKIYTGSYEGFSVSTNGTIAYINFNGGEQAVIDKTHGTIWTIDSNGNNAKPLTYNIY